MQLKNIPTSTTMYITINPIKKPVELNKVSLKAFLISLETKPNEKPPIAANIITPIIPNIISLVVEATISPRDGIK